MAKRPVPKYDFKAFGAAIKAARTGRKESRKKVSDEMFISPRYLANIENKGQHPSLQIFFELIIKPKNNKNNLIKRARRTDAEPIICSLKYCCYRLFFDLICAPNNHIGAKSELLLVVL